MPLNLNPAMAATDVSPVPEAARWVSGVDFPANRPLINVSQAAPVAAPPEPMRRAMADAVLNDQALHLYGPDLGMPELRAEVAAQVSRLYNGSVQAEQVAITSGCNQAFAATIATLAGPGDEVLLPTPWYFNHKMWLDMSSITAVPLPAGANLIPDPEVARGLITDLTRAIVLVTPNNPGGVEYPAPVIAAFRDLAREHGLALLIDETYRDFHSQTGAPHGLFEDPEWQDTVVQLYSFSKAYRLTGHRVGAIVTSASRLAEVEKFIDSVTICPSQVGQFGAVWGMRNLGDWLASERLEILDRRDAMIEGFASLEGEGWRLKGCGAYFAYVEHPFEMPSDVVARRLVEVAGILCLPGTMFTPKGDASGARHLRVAFANIDRAEIGVLVERLRGVTLTD
ncbi:aspartate/methionine/tyrosine aminotransferase [Aliiruegeria haliotis]|uniref:aspartate transaminase n=1 Tax=Aliiruegeria haliotis TaxID=1280846 RepID=A0A2T0RZM6_9RHOB|nr:aminotransferase [Aliiruegeria haliotis]PRY26600.1 aspartate/methionine/tyrosine aminotransferase [Aliiruegeria haliotis]